MPRALEQDEETTRKVIHKMMDKYVAEDRGVRIIELDGAYQMCTKTEMYEYLIRVASQPKKHVLTDVLVREWKGDRVPVKRTIKNNKFLYRQPCYGWRYFMLLLYIAHDISLVSLHAVSFEVVGCCSNLCN